MLPPGRAVAEPSPSLDVNVGNTLFVSTNAVDQANQLVNSSTNTLFGFLTAELCNAMKATVGQPLSTIVCELGLLQFTIHTVYNKPGGGTVVRDTTAFAQVPTLVDMTGDGLPDAIATVGLTSLNALSIQVNRVLTAPTTVPAQLEVVVRDPSNVQSPSRIAIGYDQRSSTIPATFKARPPSRACRPFA